MVTDPRGRRTGYNPNTKQTFKEIPSAEYYKEFVANADPESDAPDLPPATILQTAWGAIDGIYVLDIYPKPTKSYSVEMHGYESNGYLNFALLKSGSARNREKISVTFDHTSVPLIDGKFQIEKAVFLDPKQSHGNRLLLEGKLISDDKPISFARYVTFSVGRYSRSVAVTKLKKSHTGTKAAYSYEGQDNDGISFRVEEDGAFVFRSRDISIQDVHKPQEIQVHIQIDNLKAVESVEFKPANALLRNKEKSPL